MVDTPIISVPKQFGSVDEAATLIGLSSKSLRGMIERGECPHLMSGTKVLVNIPGTLKILSMKSMTSLNADLMDELSSAHDGGDRIDRRGN